MSGGEEEILFGHAGGLATILINRPQALNALTLDNYRRLAPMLAAWGRDKSVHAVAIRGAGGRAFCAGGDIRAIYEAGRGIAGDPLLTSIFFREEYEVIRQVHRFSRPYVALVDGIAMGGGAGMSINGAYRVATERTVFAMPETAIGLFPDVGATRFLNLCPGRIGRYLGLSGARLGPADALYCGFATHFVPQERIEALYAALGALHWQEGAEAVEVEAVLGEFAGDPGPAPIARLRPVIDRAFAAPTVAAILAALAGESGEGAGWAERTRAELLQKSPLSLAVALRQLDTGRGYDLDRALALEYRLTQHFMAGHDFYEGVRAMLIDKDRTPRWRPASLAEIDAALVDSYFAPLGEGELRFD
ncbi:MAG TPA: enoyl-CoA hydratase/isomerase family protein [Stellaceae bacterium]|nr:enoyl-CoA hydratase/isomerase family protein [Stellaceae bacterium]